MNEVIPVRRENSLEPETPGELSTAGGVFLERTTGLDHSLDPQLPSNIPQISTIAGHTDSIKGLLGGSGGG